MRVKGSASPEILTLEKYRELFGENKHEFTGVDYIQYYSDIITGAGSELTELMNCSASNFRWLWPIPQAEIDSNPQISEQQNPGY